MIAIAHYVPSREMLGILSVASECFDADMLRVVRGVALARLADDMASAMVRTNPARGGTEWRRYFINAPESATRVDALIQAARADWLRDPS